MSEGRTAAAISSFERALALTKLAGTSPGRVARVQFGLARARQDAALARAAERGFQAAGDGHAGELAAVRQLAGR